MKAGLLASSARDFSSTSMDCSIRPAAFPALLLSSASIARRSVQYRLPTETAAITSTEISAILAARKANELARLRWLHCRIAWEN